MAYVYTNPNPLNQKIGDCVIRAISIATGMTWDETYNVLTDYGIEK